MISLFNINNYNVDTSKFTSLLHDNIVSEFEENFASYCGAKYAVSLNSATNAIYLLCKLLDKRDVYNKMFTIPSLIPPVVCNAIITGGHDLVFNDDIKWIGSSFILGTVYNQWMHESYNIIDSAQEVTKKQFNNYNENDLVYYSFYPTKVCGGADGAMIVSNDKEKIDLIRQMSFNGMTQEYNNWERKQTMIGYKMYMNSLSAWIANENLKRLDEKKEALKVVRDIYNAEFGLNNTSEHLYRINVKNRDELMLKAKQQEITLGIHYECAHLNPIFGQTHLSLPNSEAEAKTTVSIPYHEKLSKQDIDKVIKLVNG